MSSHLDASISGFIPIRADSFPVSLRLMQRDHERQRKRRLNPFAIMLARELNLRFLAAQYCV